MYGRDVFVIPELFRQLDHHEIIERRLRGRSRGYTAPSGGGARGSGGGGGGARVQWQQGVGAGVAEDDALELSISELFIFSFVRFAVESSKTGGRSASLARRGSRVGGGGGSASSGISANGAIPYSSYSVRGVYEKIFQSITTELLTYFVLIIIIL